MTDDAAVFLHRARQKARNVLDSDERNVERVAEAHEPCALHGCVDVERPRQIRRLIGDDAHRAPAETSEADEDVARVVRVHLEEGPIVDDRVNDVEHVVRLIGRRGHNRVQCRIGAVDRIVGGDARRVVQVVARHE